MNERSSSSVALIAKTLRLHREEQPALLFCSGSFQIFGGGGGIQTDSVLLLLLTPQVQFALCCSRTGSQSLPSVCYGLCSLFVPSKCPGTMQLLLHCQCLPPSRFRLLWLASAKRATFMHFLFLVGACFCHNSQSFVF